MNDFFGEVSLCDFLVVYIVLLIHKRIKVGAKVCSESIFHALLEDQLKHFARLSCILAGDDVTRGEGFHLPHA